MSELARGRQHTACSWRGFCARSIIVPGMTDDLWDEAGGDIDRDVMQRDRDARERAFYKVFRRWRRGASLGNRRILPILARTLCLRPESR